MFKSQPKVRDIEDKPFLFALIVSSYNTHSCGLDKSQLAKKKKESEERRKLFIFLLFFNSIFSSSFDKPCLPWLPSLYTFRLGQKLCEFFGLLFSFHVLATGLNGKKSFHFYFHFYSITSGKSYRLSLFATNSVIHSPRLFIQNPIFVSLFLMLIWIKIEIEALPACISIYLYYFFCQASESN